MNTTRNGVKYLDCVRDDEEAAKLGDLVSRFGNFSHQPVFLKRFHKKKSLNLKH